MNRPNEMRTVFVAVDLARAPDFALGPLSVRPSLRRVIRDGREEAVQPRVMQVLVALARATGAVVSRDELVETCWDGIIVGDDSITRCITRARQLADCGGVQAFEIETIPRVGYRLIPRLAEGSSAKPNGSSVAQSQDAVLVGTATPDAMRLVRRIRWRKAALPAAVVVASVAIAAALLASLLGSGRNSPRPPASAPAPMAAVLPFTPLYADENAQSYADEISSDVASTLGQTDLSVISPALSFQFRGDAKARAARALHADILIDGDVRRNGDIFNVSVRVEDVASGVLLLSRDIQRPVSQAADLPDQVATFVAGALGYDTSIRALNSDRRWPPRVRTGILRAISECPYRSDPFCAYQVGRELVGVAPDNATAQTILAIATTSVLDSLPEREWPAAITTARKAAWTAIRLDPHYGDPYIALSELAPDTATREAYLRKGLAVDPDSLGSMGYLSTLLSGTGRNNEALELMQKVAARFKFRDYGYTNQINAMFGLGATAEAVELAKRGRRLWPDTRLFAYFLFDAAAFQGDPARAEAMLSDPEIGPILQPPGVAPTFVHMVRALRTRRAEDIDQVSRDCAHFDVGHWWRTRPCVLVLTMLGRIDDAFRLPMGRIDDQFHLGLAESPSNLLFWPQTAPLRADPRFLGLTEKMHLFFYWKSTHRQPDFCATEHVPVCQALAR